MSGPTQTIYAETQALYNCAHTWRTSATDELRTAQEKAANGEGQGYLFGVALNDLVKPHDEFAKNSADVLGTGKHTAQGFGAAIEQTAKNFEATDSQRATLLTKQEAGLE